MPARVAAGPMEWSDRFSTGVAILDEQHRTIFRWITELESAATEQRTLFAAYTITRLKHYVREHFAVEEAFMSQAGFPDLERHAAEHANFRTRLGYLQIESAARDVTADTVALLREWLSGHICHCDMEYVPYLATMTANRIAADGAT